LNSSSQEVYCARTSSTDSLEEPFPCFAATKEMILGRLFLLEFLAFMVQAKQEC